MNKKYPQNSKTLLDEKIITTSQELIQKYKPKLLRTVGLHSDYTKEGSLTALLDQLERSKKQKQIILAYYSLCKASERVSVAELKKASGGTSTQIKALIDKSIFEEHFVEVDRLKLEGLQHIKSL